MELAELKQMITDKTIGDDFLIFVVKDNNFLAHQYVDAISEIRQLDKTNINSIYEPLTDSLSTLLETNTNLNILTVDTFEERSTDYSQFTDTIVICNKVDKKIEKVVSEFIVTFPKLEAWQVQMYMKNLCPVLDDESIKWLYEAAGGDIYRITNELSKVTLFNKDEQRFVFSELKAAKDSDLYSAMIFNLSNAIVNNDRLALYEFYGHINNIDIDPIALTTLVLNNLKKILLVCYSGKSAADLGMEQKQFNGVKYHNSGYPLDKLISSIDFLSKIDLRLKSSELDLTKQRLLDYIVCRIAI